MIKLDSKGTQRGGGGLEGSERL